MRVFTCTDHAGLWVGVASVVVADDEEGARALLDAELTSRKLSASDKEPYTLSEIPLSGPSVRVLQDGDY
jgi:hypothetical protein